MFNPEWTNKLLTTFAKDKILCLTSAENVSE